jgi:hypothetical protein
MSRYRNTSRRGGSMTTTITTALPPTNAPLATVRENGNTNILGIPSISNTNYRTTCGRTVGGGKQRRSLSRSGASIVARRNIDRPWQAPSVQALSSRMGNNTTARPLLVEGPAGPVISAVGSSLDNKVANTALIEAQKRRMEQGLKMPRKKMMNSNVVERGGGSAFGAVYEYRDSFGIPRIVSNTSSTPEGAFLSDTRQHQGIRNFMVHQGGHQNVVWAGVGTYPLGKKEMTNITESIVEQRSKKYKMQKLSGHKPYSRHGY